MLAFAEARGGSGGAGLLSWVDQALHEPLLMAQEGRECLSFQFEAECAKSEMGEGG